MKSKPRTRLAPQMGLNLWLTPQSDRHLSGVAVDFFSLCVFAFFLEVSCTIIVTVHFFTWKVRRIRTTPFRRRWNQPPACLLSALHRTLSGEFILQNLTGNVNNKALCAALDKPGERHYNNNEEQTTHTVSSLRQLHYVAAATKTTVTFGEWRLLFLRVLLLPSLKSPGQ